MSFWDGFIQAWSNFFYGSATPQPPENPEPIDNNHNQEEAGMKHFACCAAINNYKGSSNDLRGCVNDAKDWADLVKSKGFPPPTMLLDSKATIKNVTNAWKKIFKEAVAGDQVFLSYSGHGSHMADKNGDEADGRDECLVLYDGYLSDDQIRLIFALKKEGVKLFFVSDSCHSGTVTRSFLDTMTDETFYSAPRFLPPKDDLEAAALDTLSLSVKAFASPQESDMDHILLSGCLPTEYSYDANIGGKFRGAMSYYATKIIRENPDVTYAEFYKKLQKALPSRRYPQTPQLEGTGKDQKMFS